MQGGGAWARAGAGVRALAAFLPWLVPKAMLTPDQLTTLRRQIKAYRMLLEATVLLAQEAQGGRKGAGCASGRQSNAAGRTHQGLRFWGMDGASAADAACLRVRGSGRRRGVPAAPASDADFALALAPRRRSTRLTGQAAKRYIDELPANFEDLVDDLDDNATDQRRKRRHVEGGVVYDNETVRWDTDKPPTWEPVRHAGAEECCSVCGDVDADAENVFVYCDGIDCHTIVHLQCHGLKSAPEGEWFCDTCAAGLPANKRPACALCPVAGGAHRRVVGKAAASRPWCHIACALWVPEVHFEQPQECVGINLDQLAKGRMALQCELCKQAGGGAMQCAFPRCCRAFHPLCARSAKWILAFTNSGEAVGFCQEHSRNRFEARRTAIISPPTLEDDMAILNDAALVPAPVPLSTQLSEYELERQRNIDRNKEMMARLGIMAGRGGAPAP